MKERNEIKDIVEALYRVKIAIESLNPDPTQTIKEYKRRQSVDRYLLYYSTVVSTLAALAIIANLIYSLFM